MAKWIDRLISKGHTRQFTSVPPRFNGIVETTLSSKGQQLSLLAELQQLLAKKQRMETLWPLLRRCSPGSLMRLLGMMSAAHRVVPLGLLHMRRLQRWPSRLRIDPVTIPRSDPLGAIPELSREGCCHAKFVPAAKFVPGASSIRNPFQTCLATDDRVVRCLATDDRVE
ncbi:unnamed protein product [Boreogadus saida]